VIAGVNKEKKNQSEKPGQGVRERPEPDQGKDITAQRGNSDLKKEKQRESWGVQRKNARAVARENHIAKEYKNNNNGKGEGKGKRD